MEEDKITIEPVWRRVNPLGRPRAFATPDDLWYAALDYFDWVKNNPLPEQKLFHSQGVVVKDTVYHIRAMTISAMCLHIGITYETFLQYSKKANFSLVTKGIKTVIYNQKLEGAAAGLLKENIIAREIGLADKAQVEAKVDGEVEHNHSIGLSDDIMTKLSEVYSDAPKKAVDELDEYEF